jgi:hypothetical protein
MLQCTMPEEKHDDLARRLLSAADRGEEERQPPPQVYRVHNADHWIVQPPEHLAFGEEKMIFTGSQAKQRALTYAHEKFGNARFFPY